MQGILLLVVFCGFSAFAKPPKTKKAPAPQASTATEVASQPSLSLKAAVRKALDNNHAVQAAREKIEQGKYDTKAVQALLFPNISFTAGAGEYKSASRTSGNEIFGGSSYNQYTADFKLTQPLLQFGSIAAIHVADYSTELDRIDLEIAERDLTNDVIQAFYKVLLNQDLLQILQRTEKVVEESLATAQSRLRTGRGQLLDVLQVKTQIALLKPQVADMQNQLESAAAQLATLMSESGQYEMKVVGDLKGLHFKDMQKFMDHRAARLPELDRVLIQRRQLDEQKDVTEGKHLPSLGLVGDYGAISNVKSRLTSADARDWSVILQLTIPLFSGFESIYQRRSYASQDRQLEQASKDLENRLLLTQIQSLKTLQSTEASMNSAEEAAGLARQSMNEAKRNYRLATIDFVQYLQVEQSQLQADSQLDTIRYNNLVAFANYFKASGMPLSTLVDVLEGKH